LPEPYEWRSTTHHGYFLPWEIWRKGAYGGEGMYQDRETGDVVVRGDPQPRAQLEAALRSCNATE
jgi:hypothetical protein